MKPERPIRAAGFAANHCDALFRQRAEPADLLPEFGRLGERLARQLGPALASFGGGTTPEVRMAGVERQSGAELGEAIGTLAANCLLAIGGGRTRLLLSIDGGALLAQLDRAFGGTGEIGAKLPAALPLSADLLAQRVEHGFADLLAEAIAPVEALAVLERSNSYATLAPFKKNEALVALTFEVFEAGARSLTLRLAARADSLSAILPSTDTRRRAPSRNAGPLDAPFADIALSLEAVLTEMRVPLSRVATFAPGQTIPIPVARAVPLRVGGTIVARGTVGELDDRVALQITNAIASRKDFQ